MFDNCSELHPMGFIRSDDSIKGPDFIFCLARKKIITKQTINIKEKNRKIVKSKIVKRKKILKKTPKIKTDPNSPFAVLQKLL